MLYNNTNNSALSLQGNFYNKPILILTKLPKMSAFVSKEATSFERKTFSAKIV